MCRVKYGLAQNQKLVAICLQDRGCHIEPSDESKSIILNHAEEMESSRPQIRGGSMLYVHYLPHEAGRRHLLTHSI